VPKKHYFNQTPLYEANYARLKRLIPNSFDGINNVLSLANNSKIKFALEIIESHKFTVVVVMKISYDFSSPLITNPSFKIRICHDASVAEVIAYHHHANFKPDYHYPNQDMLHKDEKQQVNRLLGEFLDYFINDKRAAPLELLGQLP
jgi:uncharacterized protein YqiB (DUF1249 family)